MKEGSPKRVLVVSVTAAFRHSAIPTGEKVLAELAQKSGAFTVENVNVEPTDARFRNAETGKPDTNKVNEVIAQAVAERLSTNALKNYDGVIFNNTTGDLPLPDEAGFLKWIADGHAFIGIHAATDTFRGHTPLDPYVLMLGAEFKTHGPQVEVEVINQDPAHPACKHYPKTFRIYDEIYQVNGFERDKVHGLLTLDKHPNTKQPGDYPIAWCKIYGRGRASRAEPRQGAAAWDLIQKQRRAGRIFYTSLGHREDVWDANWRGGQRLNDPAVAEAFQKHLLGGILWALGLEPGDATPQTAKSSAP